MNKLITLITCAALVFCSCGNNKPNNSRPAADGPRQENHEMPGAPYKMGKPGKPGEPDKMGNPQRPGNPDKMGKPEKRGKRDRAGRPEKPGKPEEMGNPECQSKESPEDWQERIRAEKVGFLTGELGLTTEEAQKFWPVYDAGQKKHFEAFEKVHTTYEALEKALKDNSSSDEIAKLTDAYVTALKESDAVEPESIASYKEVLPADKVAKLILAEEKFRRDQIHRLREK